MVISKVFDNLLLLRLTFVFYNELCHFDSFLLRPGVGAIALNNNFCFVHVGLLLILLQNFTILLGVEDSIAQGVNDIEDVSHLTFPIVQQDEHGNYSAEQGPDEISEGVA